MENKTNYWKKATITLLIIFLALLVNLFLSSYQNNPMTQRDKDIKLLTGISDNQTISGINTALDNSPKNMITLCDSSATHCVTLGRLPR